MGEGGREEGREGGRKGEGGGKGREGGSHSIDAASMGEYQLTKLLFVEGESKGGLSGLVLVTILLQGGGVSIIRHK